MPETTTFGDMLKQRRKELDLTQAELARRVGCTPSTIRMIELGERRASKQLALLLADHLHVAPAEQEGFLQAARSLPGARPVTVEQAPTNAPQATPDLPQYLTPLIGREIELAALEEQLLNTDKRGIVRLLTLSGPAGVGKTRLATALAERLQNKFADGVYFVALASISEAERTLAAIAAALDTQAASAGALLKALTQRLSGKQALLVLDNMEQIIAAGPDIAALLTTSATVKVLVTSREPLHVRGEHIFPVAPLALPDTAYFPPLAALPGYSAVALFIERAQEAQPGFALTVRNAQAIAAICDRLDGLPLAIELIAARMAQFSPNTALAKLNEAGQEAFQLLDDGPRDLPPRQQSLYAAISWSYDLLSAPEQALFARLAVFVGGCTLDAIEQVCLKPGETESAALGLVTSLLSKNLLVRDRAANDEEEPRFLLLETLREYALAQLEAGGRAATEQMRRRHADYFLAVAAAASAPADQEGNAVWAQRWANDHDNIQAALNWTLAHGDVEGAAMLAGALTDFRVIHRHPAALRSLLLVLEQQQNLAAPTRRRLLEAAIHLALGIRDLALAQRLAEENMVVARRLGDSHDIIQAETRLAAVAVEKEDFAEAAAAYRESLRLAEEIGDKVAQATALNGLGEIARATAVGDFSLARSYYEASLQLAQAVGSRWRAGIAWHNLGLVALRMGDPQSAVRLLQQSLRQFKELEAPGLVVYCLAGLSAAMLHYGAAGRAVTIMAAANAAIQRSGIMLQYSDEQEYRAALRQAEQRLNPVAFQSAWDAGQHMPPDRLLDFALEDPNKAPDITNFSAAFPAKLSTNHY